MKELPIRFTASSGNAADVLTVVFGNRISFDFKWEKQPSQSDIDEADKWAPEEMQRLGMEIASVTRAGYLQGNQRRKAWIDAFLGVSRQ